MEDLQTVGKLRSRRTCIDLNYDDPSIVGGVRYGWKLENAQCNASVIPLKERVELGKHSLYR